MKILCVICARAGSKGVENKNFKFINGKPLIYYTINQAIKTKIFDNIVISTNSKKILNFVKKQGIGTWFLRPKKLSHSKSPKVLSVQHALKEAEKFYMKKFDIIFDLDVSSPLRSINDIKSSLRFFLKKKAKMLLSGCKSKKNPYYNMVEIFRNKIKRVKILKRKITRRQDAPTTFDLNASIYIWKRKTLINFKSFYDSKTVFFEMPPSRSVDIDNKFDFKIVNFLLKKNAR